MHPGFEDCRGIRLAQLANDSEHAEDLQHIVRQVDFPPSQALAGAEDELVVIVVPAFSQRNHGEEEIVPALVPGFRRWSVAQLSGIIPRTCSTARLEGLYKS